MSVFNILAGQANPGQNRSPTSYTVVSNKSSLIEGDTVIFTIVTSNIPNATVLYWTNAGTTTGADFSDGINSGSITIQNNSATISKTLPDDYLAENPDTIIIQLRTVSTSGTIVATGPTVTVWDPGYSVYLNPTAGSQKQHISTGAPSVGQTEKVFSVECFFYLTRYLYSNGAGPIGVIFSSNTFQGSWLILNGTASSVTSIQHTWLNSSGPPVISASGLSIDLNIWHHIAIARNVGTWGMWLNGTKIASSATNPNNGYYSGSILIGGGNNTNDAYAGYFPGYISNFRYVKGNYAYDPAGGNITVPTRALTAISGTTLLTCQSAIFNDNSGNNYTVTPMNSASINYETRPFS